ncbi:MAG: LbetaH domain-containing protein [Methermicoccaceae archaeon]
MNAQESTSTSTIRYHPSTNTYIVREGYVEDNLYIKGNLLTAPSVHMWRDVVVQGELVLSRGCTVGGTARAKSAVIGARCSIRGDLLVEDNLVLLDGCEISRGVQCGGNVMVRPNVVAESLHANGVVEMVGRSRIAQIDAKKLVAVPEEVM